MFKKNDPLVDAVKSVMKESDLDRQAEAAVNETFGVVSRRAIPHERLAEYDAALTEAKKCMYEGKPLVGDQHKLDVTSPKKPGMPDGKLTLHDFKALRAGKKKEIEEKWHEESGKKKELDEKLTKDMSAGDIISDFTHSTDPKFKGKSKAMRKKMALGAYYGMHPEKSKKMEEETVFEEIRNNLEEQLVSVYESGDEEAFADFVSSLTEEQIEILGLNEAVPPSSGVANPPPSKTVTQQTNFAGARDAAAGAKSTPDAKAGSGSVGTPSPSTSASDRMSSTAHMGGPAPTTAPTSGAIQSTVTGRFTPPTPESARGQKTPGVGAERFGKGGPGGYSDKNLTGDASKGATSAGTKIAAQVAKVNPNASTPSTAPKTAAIAKPAGGPKPVAKPAAPGGVPSMQKKLGYGTTRAGASAGETMMANLMREEVKPQIKESFEQFLRNKFLKG